MGVQASEMSVKHAGRDHGNRNRQKAPIGPHIARRLPARPIACGSLVKKFPANAGTNGPRRMFTSQVYGQRD